MSWGVEDEARLQSLASIPRLLSSMRHPAGWVSVHRLAQHHRCSAALRINCRGHALASGIEMDAEDAAASRSAGAAGIFAQAKAAEPVRIFSLKVSGRHCPAHQLASWKPWPSL